MVNLLTIEDSHVKSMIKDPRILTLVPCLASAKQGIESVAKGGTNCKKCRSQKSNIQTEAIRSAKDCLRSLGGKQRDELKRLLGAKQLRFMARNASGKRVVYTV